MPFLVFLIQRRFSWRLATPLATLFVLGGLQGVLGWWMVSSGLVNLTSVSQYRLAAHLSAALVLFLALIWVARSLEPAAKDAAAQHTARWPIALLLLLIMVQVAAGAFVAGLQAGMGYNTWPLMDGALIPAGLGVIEPAWRNLFENALTVQFVHRTIAYVIVLYAIFLIWRQSRAGGLKGVNGWLPPHRRADPAAGGARHHYAADLRPGAAGARPPGAGLHAGPAPPSPISPTSHAFAGNMIPHWW